MSVVHDDFIGCVFTRHIYRISAGGQCISSVRRCQFFQIQLAEGEVCAALCFSVLVGGQNIKQCICGNRSNRFFCVKPEHKAFAIVCVDSARHGVKVFGVLLQLHSRLLPLVFSCKRFGYDCRILICIGEGHFVLGGIENKPR